MKMLESLSLLIVLSIPSISAIFRLCPGGTCPFGGDTRPQEQPNTTPYPRSVANQQDHQGTLQEIAYLFHFFIFMHEHILYLLIYIQIPLNFVDFGVMIHPNYYSISPMMKQRRPISPPISAIWRVNTAQDSILPHAFKP